MQALSIDACPACGNRDYRIVFSPDAAAWDRFMDLSRRKYRHLMDAWREQLTLEVGQCRQCHHLWHHTQPDQSSLLEMYQAGESLTDEDPARAPSAHMVSTMQALFQLASSRTSATPRLLDYGSGHGRWTRAAAQAGFDVTAYEPSDRRAASGDGDVRTVFNLDSLGSDTFDVINMEQVLEHLQDPAAALRGLAPYLKSTGVLRLTTPNLGRCVDSELWRQFPFDGQRMHILSPFEHLQGFNAGSLRTLLHRVGLTDERSVAAWKTHPAQITRDLLGRWIRPISTTSALVNPGPGFG